MSRGRAAATSLHLQNQPRTTAKASSGISQSRTLDGMEIFLDFLFNSSQNWTREKIDRTILRWSLKSVSQPNDSAMGWAINKKLFQQKENLSEKSSSELFEPKFLNQKLLTPKFPLFREKLSSLFYEDGRGLCRVGDTIFRPFLNSKSKSLWVKTHMAIACWRGWH